MNVTAQLQKQMQMPSGPDGGMAQITALAIASQQGAKYLVAGDAEGKVSVFTKNGTLRASMDTESPPGKGVETLHAHLSNLLFRAGDRWGYLDLERLEVKHMECDKLEGRIAHVVIDSQQTSRVLVSDEAGTVWVLNSKNKKNCTVDVRFAPGASKAPMELASVRGYVIGLDRPDGPGQPAHVMSLNMSHSSKRRSDFATAPSAVVWRKVRPATKAWAVHKRYQQGDLLAFLSESGHEVEIMELLMSVYTAPAADSFGNFKLPVIAVAVVLVLGYQYMKQKGKFGGGKGKYDFGNTDFSALRNKKKFGGGLGGLGGLKGKRF